MPSFHVVPGGAVRDILAASPAAVAGLVRETYLLHGRGGTVNPSSHFLRFPARPDSRIIALPAHLEGDQPVSGLKWIASYPANIERNLPRASAVLILNDAATGYPLACLEASQISAARTAASAALAAAALAASGRVRSAGFVGAGVIARTVCDYLAAGPLPVTECSVYDRVPRYAEKLAGYAQDRHGWSSRADDDLGKVIASSDLVVLATTASRPHLTDPGLFRPGQVILHLSLRDIDPAIMLGCTNIVDDVDHCLTAQTSAHLAEQASGARDFVAGTLADVLGGQLTLDADRPVVFSPFGLGVLDLAVGRYVYQAARRDGRAIEVDGFFADLMRW
jgi:ornithine cyclodeaminase